MHVYVRCTMYVYIRAKKMMMINITVEIGSYIHEFLYAMKITIVFFVVVAIVWNVIALIHAINSTICFETIQFQFSNGLICTLAGRTHEKKE